MSFSTLRVELPAYSHSFQVQVTPSSSVRDVKHEIAKVCPGSPSPEGQRLIWRGRFLRDEEKVEDIWKSPEASRVVHLAVHPSAWASTPPPVRSLSSTHSSTRPDFTQSRTSAGQPTPTYWQPPFIQSHPYPPLSASFPPVAYIQHLHNTALGILSTGGIMLPAPLPINELETWRSAAKNLYRSQGWVWPDIFEQPFPSGSAGQGATYQPVMVEGLPYLQLTNVDATPTASQLHALRVLSHTFSILSMANDPMLYTPATAHYPRPYATATNVNQRLQQLGLPHLRLAQGAIPNPHDPNNHNPLPAPAPGVPAAEIRAIPVRALMIPLMMLVFRTLLLLYFFSPSKRPLFGLLLSVWILYEAWNAMRLVLNDGNDREAGGAANPGVANGAAGPVAGQPAPGAGAGVGRDVNGNGTATRSPASAVLDRLSTLNLAAEDAILDTDAPVPEPGLAQKTKMFCALFFMTLWPSAWDRRRNALRRREGRIRTDANAREAVVRDREEADAGGDGQGQNGEQPQRSEEDLARARQREQMVARHERRPAWLRQYVQRVEYTEWVDDP